MSSTAWRATRRGVLQLGTVVFCGLTLPRVLYADAARRQSGQTASADGCILIFLNGGPSHLDTWDMKPEAPAEIRGEFKPIASSVPGLVVCEHLPRLAPLMHRVAVLRSLRHSVNNAHAAAVYTALTGHDRGDANTLVSTSPQDYPAIGATVTRQRPPERAVVPFVSLPYITKEGAGGPPQPGFFGGWLGRGFDPLFVVRDPNAPDFAVPELSLSDDISPQRLDGRKRLLHALSGLSLPGANVRGVETFRERALALLDAPATRMAFRLTDEPLALRESYGRNIYGQSVLLARRLIEAGTRVVTISWAPDANATWDTHGQNFAKLRETLLPQLDRAVSSLLDDLHQRDMLQRTLVVVMGEFGRTPRINANAGRDHWNFCYSALLAGGGVRGGMIHGASDRIGALPSVDPLGPADVVATIYQCLGIPPTHELTDPLGRPLQLVPWGTPIEAILA